MTQHTEPTVTHELRECPFCGEAPDIELSFSGGPYVLCGQCGAATMFFDTEAEAIAAWNTRPSEAAATKQALERAAELARQWRDENKASFFKAVKQGNDELAAMIDGAAIECDAIATAILALIPGTNDG